jgi:hypothetical protein
VQLELGGLELLLQLDHGVLARGRCSSQLRLLFVTGRLRVHTLHHGSEQ